MIRRFGPGLILGAALVAVVGWPALATVIDAVRGASNPGGGLLTPIPGGAAIRPWRLAGETIRLVATTEALAIPAGLALAFLLFRTDLPGRRAGLGLLALSACVPMPLQATGWLGGFGNLGRSQAIGPAPILVGRFGAAFVHAVGALPWIVWIVGTGLRGVEPELEESARLEMPLWRVAWSVTLRRSLGAIAGAALAVAVLTAGDMTVTDLLAIRTYAEEAYLQYGIGNGPGAAASVALPPLVVLGALIVVGARALARSDPARVVSSQTAAAPWRLGAWRWAAGLGVAIVLGALAGLPLYALIWRAGRVGGDAAQRIAPHWSAAGLSGTLAAAASDVIGPVWRRPSRSPLVTSLVWGGLGGLGAVALAWSLAWACRRPGPWRRIAAASAALTLATPGPVAGMALVLAYHRVGVVYETPAIVVLAYTLRTWPYALLVIWPAIRSIPPEYFEAAELDGCGPLAQARRVALPLTLGAAGLAWGVAAVLALGELPATWLVAPPGFTTITSRVFDLLHIGVESRLAGIALVTLGLIGTGAAVVLAARRALQARV